MNQAPSKNQTISSKQHICNHNHQVTVVVDDQNPNNPVTSIISLYCFNLFLIFYSELLYKAHPGGNLKVKLPIMPSSASRNLVKKVRMMSDDDDVAAEGDDQNIKK